MDPHMTRVLLSYGKQKKKQSFNMPKTLCFSNKYTSNGTEVVLFLGFLQSVRNPAPVDTFSDVDGEVEERGRGAARGGESLGL